MYHTLKKTILEGPKESQKSMSLLGVEAGLHTLSGMEEVGDKVVWKIV